MPDSHHKACDDTIPGKTQNALKTREVGLVSVMKEASGTKMSITKFTNFKCERKFATGLPMLNCNKDGLAKYSICCQFLPQSCKLLDLLQLRLQLCDHFTMAAFTFVKASSCTVTASVRSCARGPAAAPTETPVLHPRHAASKSAASNTGSWAAVEAPMLKITSSALRRSKLCT